MKKLILPLFYIILIAFPTFTVAQMNTENVKVDVIAVRMYADWCGNCKILDAKIEAIKTEIKDSQVLFLYFDQTDDFKIRQSEMLAYMMGLDEVFAKYKGKTGMLLLINPGTGELIEEVNHRVTEAELKNKIESKTTR